MGMRGQRFALIADNGVVKALNVEAPGEFKVSAAAAQAAAKLIMFSLNPSFDMNDCTRISSPSQSTSMWSPTARYARLALVR